MPARRLTWLVAVVALFAALAALAPIVLRDGAGPWLHTSMRGEVVRLYGYGPYRHMPSDVAVQGLAQDLVTLGLALPCLVAALIWARRGARAGHLALCGALGYLFVQYLMYLAMATYNELYLLWVALVLLTSQALVRLLLALPAERFAVANDGSAARRFVGGFLLGNGALIALLWLNVIVPPLLTGALYPAGLAHLTTMIVQGFDLALFLPASFIAGFRYLRRSSGGELLAGAYSAFLTLQMSALLAKILWMHSIGVSAGPALVVIPLLLLGAFACTLLVLRSQRASIPVAR